MADNLKSIKEIFDIISLTEPKSRASFISIHHTNLALINK